MKPSRLGEVGNRQMTRREVLRAGITAAAGAAVGPFVVTPARAQATDLAPGETLTLDRAIAIALARHPARKTAEAEAGAAEERAGAARSALLPHVSGVAESSGVMVSRDLNGVGTESVLTTNTGLPDAYAIGMSEHMSERAEPFTTRASCDPTADPDIRRATLAATA